MWRGGICIEAMLIGTPPFDVDAVTERHFGLGPRQKVDVSVEFYPSGVRVQQTGVRADMTLEIVEPAPK